MKEWMDVSEDSLVKIRRTDENHIELLLDNGRVLAFEGLEKCCDDCYRGIHEMFGAAGPVFLDVADLVEILLMGDTDKFFYMEGSVPLNSCYSITDRVSSYINDICPKNRTNLEKISGIILNILGNIGFENLIKIKEMIIHNFPGIIIKVSLNDSDEDDKCRYYVVAV